MIKVTFNYDPDTNKVSGVTAVSTEVKASVAKTAKPKTATKTSDYIVLKGGSLQLTQDVIDSLGVLVGDRLCVRFSPHPVLVRPDIANEPKGGNLITKALTVSVRGKVGEQIAKFGDIFQPSLKSEGYLDLVANDGTDDAERQGSVEQDKPVEISDTIIDDSDFLRDIDDGVEIDFTLDII